MQTLPIDLEANPFLLPDQQRMVDRSQDFANSFSVNSEGIQNYLTGHASLMELGKTVIGFVHDELKFEKTIGRDMPQEIQTEEDLETILRFQAMSVVTRDRTLSAARSLLAIDLGNAFAHDDESQIKSSTETGARLVQVQAGSATQALLTADRWVAHRAHGIGETLSRWDRAKEAFAEHPRVKPPINIDHQEGVRFDELAERMLDMTKMALSVETPTISKFRIVNLARGIRKSMGSVSHADGMMGTSIVRDLLEGQMFPVIPILDGKDTGDAHRTIRRKIRYLQSAARLAPELATDPIVRNYVYLHDKLGGRDVSSVKSELQRDAKKVKNMAIKQKRKAEQQAELAGETTDKDIE